MSDNTDYPISKITSAYALCGGAVGGMLILLGFRLAEFYEYLNGHGIQAVFSHYSLASIIIRLLQEVIFIASAGTLWGFFIGLVPALITGVQIAKRRITRQTSRYLYYTFKIGFIVILLIGIAFMLTFFVFGLFKGLFVKPLNYHVWLWLCSIVSILSTVGGVTSAILARFVLPKNAYKV